MNYPADKRQLGLYQKFNVARTDNSHLPGGKHFGCQYFVLDLTHDPGAVPAMRAYVLWARENDYHQLADDIEAAIGDSPKNGPDAAQVPNAPRDGGNVAQLRDRSAVPERDLGVPILDGTTQSRVERESLFASWRANPEDAPDWFPLVDLLDDYPSLAEALGAYSMGSETFDEEDLQAVKALAPALPHVMCADYDPLGGDSVEGALLGLLTERGLETIKTAQKIVDAAFRLTSERGWR